MRLNNRKAAVAEALAAMLTSALILVSQTPAFAANMPAAPEMQSYTTEMICYTTTATVKASIEEFTEYFHQLGTENLDVDVDIGKQYNPDGTPKPLGNAVPSNFKRGPLRISGRTILVKSDANDMWLQWDTALESYQTRRWHFEQTDQGTVVNVTMQIDGGRMNKLMQKAGQKLVMKSLKDLDMVLVSIQAHFDPTVDLEAQKKLGLKGEIYSGILQNYDVEFKSGKSRDEIVNWLASPDADYLGVGSTSGCPYGEIAEGKVNHCLLDGGFEGSGLATDFFPSSRQNHGTYKRRTYFIAGGSPGMIQVTVKPRLGGSKVTVRWLTELPQEGAEQDLDRIMFLAGIQDRASRLAQAVYEGVR